MSQNSYAPDSEGAHGRGDIECDGPKFGARDVLFVILDRNIYRNLVKIREV